MLPIHPTPTLQAPTHKAAATAHAPAGRVDLTFLAVFGKGALQSQLPENDAPTPIQPEAEQAKAEQDTAEAGVQTATHDVQADNDAMTATGPLTPAFDAAKVERRVKPAPPLPETEGETRQPPGIVGAGGEANPASAQDHPEMMRAKPLPEDTLGMKKQRLLQLEKIKTHSVPKPAQGHDRPEVPRNVRPMDPNPPVEQANQNARQADPAIKAAHARNIATPIASNPGLAAPTARSPDEAGQDRPAVRTTAIPDRAAPRNAVITSAPANAPQQAMPVPVAAPAPSLMTDPAEDRRHGIDPALPDIRFNAEAPLRPGPPPIPQAPDLPRHIAQQLTEALHRSGGGDRGVDLVLNPAELGRVRISMSAGETGLTVHILADRPETLDLMRRHIDLLAQDFQSIGYEATDFAFAQHQQEGQDRADHSHPQPTSGPEGAPPDQAPRPMATISTDRVDIRL